MKTVIMAGGKGTRIAELFPDIPKPLIPIKNKDGIEKPVLEWEILSLVSQGYKDIILTVGYLAEKIQNYFGDGSQLGCHIRYFVEDKPLGNAGALFKLRAELGNDPFLLLNADALFDIDFNRFVVRVDLQEQLVHLQEKSLGYFDVFPDDEVSSRGT